MYSTPDQPQQWSVHAEFTISHPGMKDPLNPPKAETVQDEKGVRMLYSWTANDSTSNFSVPSQLITSDSGSSKTAYPERLFGYQKGNLFFTSTPPSKLNVPVHDSAYGSDLHSQSSCESSNFRPFNRKCKSTCNIVLAKGAAADSSPGQTSCGRTQSLRCQTPSLVYDKKSEGYYGCGDPWCHHIHCNDDLSTVRRISPVREVCEDFTNPPHGTCGESCKICDQEFKKSVKRDVSVQTYEMVNKCTSPMVQSVDSESGNVKAKTTKLTRSRAVGGYRSSRQSSVRSSTSPISVQRDTSQDLPKLSKSQSFRGTPKISTGSGSEKSDSSKKPRTIHIDVYCTGTEIESDSSSSSASDTRSKTVSTPQTVFESKNMCVTHKKADEKKLPYHLNKSISTSVEREDSDNDDSISTSYPSKMSSYSTFGRSISSMTSFPYSATPYSNSSCTVPDYESSIGNTSWKDTFSDIDSLLQSRSSIPQNDSSYFIPRRISEEVGSTRGSLKMTSTGTTNSASLAPSDSFEYANSEDKLRIKRMERMWRTKLLQNYNMQNKNRVVEEQKKLQEVVNKRLNKMNISKDSDSEASDGSEKGWTVLQAERKNTSLKPKPKPDIKTTVMKSSSTPKFFESKPNMVAEVRTSQFLAKPIFRETATKPVSPLQRSDTNESVSVCRSPSFLIIKERLSLDPSLGSPFTIKPGKYTEPRYIAKRFGPVITVYKKPGHHVGPAKNPSCSCDHCLRYFENVGYRNRTCSVGDAPMSPSLFVNWKGLKNSLQR